MSYEPTVWVDGDHVTSAKLNKLEQGVNSMSYTPTVWNAGDVVTAEKLNKLEQGVAEGGGGGSGDLTEATVTLQVVGGGAKDITNYFIGGESLTDEVITGFAEVNGYLKDTNGYLVSPNATETVKCYILKEHYVIFAIQGGSASRYIVTGEAEVVTDESDDYVKVYGDCNIAYEINK